MPHQHNPQGRKPKLVKAMQDYTCTECHTDIPKGTQYAYKGFTITGEPTAEELANKRPGTFLISKVSGKRRVCVPCSEALR
jgi:hypothetical protein